MELTEFERMCKSAFKQGLVRTYWRRGDLIYYEPLENFVIFGCFFDNLKLYNNKDMAFHYVSGTESYSNYETASEYTDKRDEKGRPVFKDFSFIKFTMEQLFQMFIDMPKEMYNPSIEPKDYANTNEIKQTLLKAFVAIKHFKKWNGKEFE